jgi:hypothetical protein
MALTLIIIIVAFWMNRNRVLVPEVNKQYFKTVQKYLPTSDFTLFSAAFSIGLSLQYRVLNGEVLWYIVWSEDGTNNTPKISEPFTTKSEALGYMASLLSYRIDKPVKKMRHILLGFTPVNMDIPLPRTLSGIIAYNNFWSLQQYLS